MKKKVYLFSALLMLAIGAGAQTQRGYVLVGSDIADLNFALNDGGGNFSTTLNPKAAWFIQDNVAIGPYLLFGLSHIKDVGTSVSYGAGLFGRLYVGRDQVNILRHTRLFFEGSAGLEGYNPSVGDNTNGLGLGIGPGITYFLTPNVGVEALLKYNGIVGFGSTPATSQLNLGIGFQIYLPGSKIRDRLQDTKK
ncbi:MAG: hypothetical protein H7Y31_16710 [Chitinophagaceae bacterium]|nr:hypothetical protein [Chitinophagaceae bacterium]